MKHLTLISFFFGWLMLTIIMSILIIPLITVMVFDVDWFDYPKQILDKI